MEDIDSAIQRIREEKGYTQDQLAEKLFVSRQTISNYERNKSQPSLEMLERIADVFDTDLASLLAIPKDTKRDKKADIRSLLLQGGIGLVLVITYHVLSRIALTQRNLYYDTRLQFWLTILLRPCLWAFGGYFIMSILTTVANIRIPKKKWFRAVDWLAAAWSVFYLVLMFPFPFQLDVSRNWLHLAYWVLGITYNPIFSNAYLVIPLVLGALLRFCHSHKDLPRTK